ncbi:MAG TPA: hypothetical protein VGR47_22815 [Terracidiphilus sp.]|nr:hypothetical protein [Terracidiphilus sp.]
MDRFPKFPFGLAAVAAFLCVSLSAQSSHHRFSIFQHPHRARTAIQTGPATAFPLDKDEPPATTDVEFRSPDRMAEADRQLEASTQSAIAQRAGLENFQLNEGNWKWQQVACRALPNHLLLRFTRDNGAGDRSMFSVSIPRGKGHLRLIPVLRRGYSLYSPAASNDSSVAVFNQIRSEDGPHPDDGWLETGLCYAALTGADPSVGPLTGNAALDSPAPPLAEMIVTLRGDAIVTFTDQAARPHPMLWSLTFSRKGTLLKVKREPAVLNARWILPQQAKQNPGRILPTSTTPPESNHAETNAASAPATHAPH